MKIHYVLPFFLLISCSSESVDNETSNENDRQENIQIAEEVIAEETNTDQLKFLHEMSQEEAFEYEPVFFYDQNGLEQGHAIYRIADFVDDPENPNEVVAEEHWVDGEIVRAIYLDSSFFAFE